MATAQLRTYVGARWGQVHLSLPGTRPARPLPVSRMRPLLIALLLPLAEIAVFVLVGGRIGALATVALVVLAAVAGVALLRSAGADAAARIRASMAQEQDPSAQIVRMAMRFIAGMLLVIPGFLTDIVALVLLAPMVQDAAFAALRHRARVSGLVFDVRDPAAQPRAPADRVIEGEYRDVTRPGRSGWTKD
jgi:UPF0716 protein FxsA